MTRGLRLRLIAAGIFVFFFAAFLAVQFSSASLTSQDDGYYHIRHSLAYCAGEPFEMPALSTMSTRPVDLYVGYHALMCPFAAGYPGDGPESYMNGAKIFTALLSAIFVTALYSVFRRTLADSSAAGRSHEALALAAVAFLFVGTQHFIPRIIYTRPHVFASLAVIAAYHFIERRNHKALFAVSAALPLFYSVSFVTLFPSLMLIAATALYRGVSAVTRETLRPLAVTAAGIATGVLLHPNLLAYLYNGYYVHLRAALNRFTETNIMEGVEMYTGYWSFANDFLWIGLLAIGIGAYAIRLAEVRPARRAVPFPYFYLALQTLVLFAGFLFIQRVSEYFFPFLALAGFWFLRDAWGWATGWLESRKAAGSPRPTAALAFVLSWVRLNRAWFAGALAIWLALGFLIIGNRVIATMRREPGLGAFRGAAEFLRDNGKDGELVFLEAFDQFPRLVYFNDRDRYSMGMGSIFTYMYDPGTYWGYFHAVNGAPICPEPECDADSGLYGFLEGRGASHVVIEKKAAAPGGKERTKLVEVLRGDPRFTLTYEDETIEVWSLQDRAPAL